MVALTQFLCLSFVADLFSFHFSFIIAITCLQNAIRTCVPFLLSGDLDWYCKWLGLTNWASANPCFACKCTKEESFDFSLTSRWRSLCWDPQEWLLANPTRCWLFRLPNLTVHNVVFDYLHNKHLGADQYFYGSAPWLHFGYLFFV